ncbi:MAG: diadenylate cyclase [Thermococci archaeon]|nr:diadenylate cyclase [Thermococci archaeon]
MDGRIPPYFITASKVLVEKSGAKAYVLLGDVDSTPKLDDVTVVVVGSKFDVSKPRVKSVSIPDELDLNSALNLISAFLLEHGIVEEGKNFVYVTPEVMGIKTVKKNLLVSKGFFKHPQTVLQRILEVAIELSVEGREGIPIGTLFVIGDVRNVLKHAHPLIPNPFKGHKVNVLDRSSKEIIKEFAQLDGAFIVSSSGRIVACGMYIKVDPQKVREELPPGLGSRHLAAAGITKTTKAVALSLSESGTIRIFKGGSMLLEYNPRMRY